MHENFVLQDLENFVTAYSCAGSSGFSPPSLHRRSFGYQLCRYTSCTDVTRGTPVTGCASTRTSNSKTRLNKSTVSTSSGLPMATTLLHTVLLGEVRVWSAFTGVQY